MGRSRQSETGGTRTTFPPRRWAGLVSAGCVTHWVAQQKRLAQSEMHNRFYRRERRKRSQGWSEWTAYRVQRDQPWTRRDANKPSGLKRRPSTIERRGGCVGRSELVRDGTPQGVRFANKFAPTASDRIRVYSRAWLISLHSVNGSKMIGVRLRFLRGLPVHWIGIGGWINSRGGIRSVLRRAAEGGRSRPYTRSTERRDTVRPP
jgi:hypothetical protein